MTGPVAISSVITPADSYDLITLDEVKDDLNISSTADDAYLQRRITELSAVARQYMNRTLQVEAVRDQFWLQRDPYPWQLPGGAMPLQLSRWLFYRGASHACSMDEKALSATRYPRAGRRDWFGLRLCRG